MLGQENWINKPLREQGQRQPWKRIQFLSDGTLFASMLLFNIHFYANKVSMNMNMIELRFPSLSKIQQKPEHPVGWFTIVTLHASYFQTLKHLNQVH